MMTRFLKLHLLVLCGLLLYSGTALALSIGLPQVNVGELDTLRAVANISNSYESELSWVQSVLGTEYGFAESDKYDTNGWTPTNENPDYYAWGLNGTPSHYFIKLGTGGTDIQSTHWLYQNSAELAWAVVNSEIWGTTRNIDVYRVSHIGEIGATPVPEPSSMLLLGMVLLVLTLISRKRFMRS